MPRGKFLNHKGRIREFTPIEELRRDQELTGCLKAPFDDDWNKSGSSVENIIYDGENSSDSTDTEGDMGLMKCRKWGGPVEGLIEISNPNRPIKKSAKYKFLSEEIKDERRRERAKNNPRTFTQKTSSEAKADLARLAVVRKKREEAAQLRLAAKKTNNITNEFETTPSTSITDISLKKKNKKYKPGSGSYEFLKKGDEHISKLVVKARCDNKGNEGIQHLRTCKTNSEN